MISVVCGLTYMYLRISLSGSVPNHRMRYVLYYVSLVTIMKLRPQLLHNVCITLHIFKYNFMAVWGLHWRNTLAL